MTDDITFDDDPPVPDDGELPEINTKDRNPAELLDETWATWMATSETTRKALNPQVHTYANSVVTMKWPTKREWALALSRVIQFVKIGKDGAKQCAPPTTLVQDMSDKWQEYHKDDVRISLRRAEYAEAERLITGG